MKEPTEREMVNTTNNENAATTQKGACIENDTEEDTDNEKYT